MHKVRLNTFELAAQRKVAVAILTTHNTSRGTSIYNVCCHHRIFIKLNRFLGPRKTAWSFLCPIYDPDDWGLSWDIFLKTDLLWGLHSIARFCKLH